MFKPHYYFSDLYIANIFENDFRLIILVDIIFKYFGALKYTYFLDKKKVYIVLFCTNLDYNFISRFATCNYKLAILVNLVSPL